jgi:SAM-dependent methyltransferase
MNLDTLKRDWDDLALRDCLWAILTDERKAGGKWDFAEFMATGNREIESVIEYLSGIGIELDYKGSALDFGCGVGRLTQALAGRFSNCVGVDISPQMIQQAENINQYPHCRYLANADVQLPFSDSSFSFIYSNIVLQHVPPRFAEQYLREFVRVLTRNAILVFGVQDSFVGPALVRIRNAVRLRSRIHCIKTALGLARPDMKMYCLPERVVRRALGSAKVVDIQFTNTAAKDFNGELIFLHQVPTAGYVSKQYCVVKEP